MKAYHEKGFHLDNDNKHIFNLQSGRNFPMLKLKLKVTISFVCLRFFLVPSMLTLRFERIESKTNIERSW